MGMKKVGLSGTAPSYRPPYGVFPGSFGPFLQNGVGGEGRGRGQGVWDWDWDWELSEKVGGTRG